MFSGSRELLQENNAEDAITTEINTLWCMVREQTEGTQSTSESDCNERIVNSFNELKKRFSDEQLNKAYAWVRYLKIALYCNNPPMHYWMEYINSDNYIAMTKRISDLTKSIKKGEDELAIRNAEKFSEAVYHHILDKINPEDIPSCLALGRAAQRKREYSEAQKWFEKAMETREPFNGLTALLACYEDETKTILSSGRKGTPLSPELTERIRELNQCQCALYEKWYCIMEKRISSIAEISDQTKKEYVAILTGYSRFERNRGDYDKAFKLLERIPDTFPDIYRVYTEEAMLYQFMSNRNRYYSLERAIATFQKAYIAVCRENEGNTVSAKCRKSILMPLANTYFQSGRYSEAESVCESVLKIDKKEPRAINLKNQIACLAS